MLESTHTLENKIGDFKNELLQISGVNSVSISGYLPVEGTTRNGSELWTVEEPDTRVQSQIWSVDRDYIRTMGMKVIEGRDFIASDSQAVIINQAMVKALSLKAPIGRQIVYSRNTYTVAGVMEDYHFESLRQPITPIALKLGESTNAMSLHVSTADTPGLIEAVTATWKKFSPNQAIRFSFLDQRYARMYDDVQRTGRLFTFFAALAIIVACLGLFALSAFMTEQRRKEISIRLVLGASISGIFTLITRNFVLLVMTAFVVAIPLSVYSMHTWLEGYAYRIDMTWDVFALAGGTALSVTFLTIGYQSLRAARTNPAQNLRAE